MKGSITTREKEVREMLKEIEDLKAERDRLLKPITNQTTPVSEKDGVVGHGNNNNNNASTNKTAEEQLAKNKAARLEKWKAKTPEEIAEEQRSQNRIERLKKNQQGNGRKIT